MATKSDAHHSKPLKSYWYEDDNRDPLVHSRITGIKLKEAGVAGYFFKKETFLTIFTFECKIANYTWSVSRSFEEFKTFHAELFSLYFLEAHKRIQTPFPLGEDGQPLEEPLEVAAVWKDELDMLLKEILQKLDPFMLPNLASFLKLKENTAAFQHKLSQAQRIGRKYLFRKELNMELLKFYSPDLIALTDTLKNGILVDELSLIPRPSAANQTDSSSRPMMLKKDRKVLWMELHTYCSSGLSTGRSDGCVPGMYRICVSSGDVVSSRRNRPRTTTLSWFPNPEDEALIDGVYLADIASVISRGCRWCDDIDHTPFMKTLSSRRTFSIIATERTFRLQLVDNNFPVQLIPVAPTSAKPTPAVSTPTRRKANKRASIGYRYSYTHMDTNDNGNNSDNSDSASSDWSLPSASDSEHSNVVPPPSPVTRQESTGKPGEYAKVKRKSTFAYRDYVVDFVNLLCLQALSDKELSLRRKFWTRCNMTCYTGFVRKLRTNEVLTSKLPSLRLQPLTLAERVYVSEVTAANTMVEKLSTPLPIVEQVVQLGQAIHMSRWLSIDVESHALNVYNRTTSRAENDTNPHSSFRQIFLKDICEVRPGNVSFAIDATEEEMSLTLVSVNSILTLPISTMAERDFLIKRFQLLLKVFQSEGDLSKASIPSRPTSVCDI